MGARNCGAPSAGHPSISDDGDGNVVVADGKQILLPALGGSTPSIASKSAPNVGIDIQSNQILASVLGTTKQSWSTIAITLSERLKIADQIDFTPGSTQSITAAATALSGTRAYNIISSDADYVLSATPTIANGNQGELRIYRNVGAYTISLQDESALAGSNIETSGGAQIDIGPNDSIALLWDDTVGAWCEFVPLRGI